MTKHFLESAHIAMSYDNQEKLWLPGCTAWTHYVTVSDSTIRRAQKDGYLSKYTGYPCLTSKGYNQF